PVLDLASQQLLPGLGLPSLADITRDLGGAKDLARRIFHRRYGERYVHESAVLALANGLIMVDVRAAQASIENAGFFVVAIRWDESGDRSAQHLPGRITEDPFSASIPARDNAVQVLADDRIVRSGNNSRQQLVGVLRTHPCDAEAQVPGNGEG